MEVYKEQASVSQKTLTPSELLATNNPALTRLANSIVRHNVLGSPAHYYSRMHNRHNRG
jgi:hypothetical protein